MTRSSVAAAAVVLATLLVSGPAPADDAPPADKAMAEALFRAGRQLIDEGKIAEGCAKLEESQRLETKVGTLLNIALCHEQLGKTATAWAEMIEVGSQAARAKQDDRVAFAKERVQALEKKLSRLTISAPGAPAGLVVSLDGKALGASTFGVPVPLDPGEHRVEATAPGKATWKTTITIAPGPASKTLEIPALGEGTGPAPAVSGTASPTSSGVATAPTGTVTVAPTATVAPGGGGTNGMFVGGVVAAGVGVAGLVVGGVFGGLTLSKEGDANKICPDKVCPTQEGLNLHNEARGLSTISTVGFAVGIAGAGVGLTLLLLSRGSSGSKDKAASTWVAPAVGPQGAGVAAGGRF